MVANSVSAPALEILHRLIEAFGHQADDYDQMLALSREQLSAAPTGDVDRIVALQQQKQAVLIRVAERDTALSPWKEQWALVREQVDEAAKAPLVAVVERLGGLMRTFIDQERETEQALRAFEEEVRRRLAAAQQHRAAARAYARIQDEARFYDRHG